MDTMVRLMYASTPVAGLQETDIRQILAAARRRNLERGITGFLAFSGRCFLQALEGSPEAVNGCYARILRDPRHVGAMLLGYDRIDCRQFVDWSMGFASTAMTQDNVLLRYASGGQLDPRQLSAVGANLLLQELAVAHAHAAASVAAAA
jgi:Sensors of blue-light using FAD